MVQEKIHIYFVRIVKIWNSMPQIDLSLTFNTIKQRLFQYFWSEFLLNFNPGNVCTLILHSTLSALVLNVNIYLVSGQ